MAIGHLPWESAGIERGFTTCQFTRLTGGDSRNRRIDRLLNYFFNNVWIEFKIFGESFRHYRADNPLHFTISELALRLAFKLRLRNFYGNNSCKAFSNVFALERFFKVFTQASFNQEFIHDPGQRSSKSRNVCSAFNRMNIIHIRWNVFNVGVIPLECHLYHHSIDFVRH